MVYRSIRISSDYFELHKEFLFIRQLGVSNGYPLSFIQNIIKNTLNRHQLHSCNNRPPNTNTSPESETPIIKQSRKDLPKKQVALVEIPYVGRLTMSYGKKLVELTKSISPQIHLQLIARPPSSIRTFFPHKEPLPKDLTSHVVYNIKCKQCPVSYIGMTLRQPERRFKEHGKPLKTKQKNQHNDDTHRQSTKSITVKRSTRNKMINKYVPTEELSDTNTATKSIRTTTNTDSAVYQHEITTGHKIDWHNWSIISKDNTKSRLLIRESLAIIKFKPTLNKTVRSTPLIIYPDGEAAFKPRVKMKTS